MWPTTLASPRAQPWEIRRTMSDESEQQPVKAVRWVGRCAVIDVVGNVDIRRSSEFQHALLAVLDRKPQRMVVNLSEVGYMDSAGVASLVKLLGKARRAQVALYLAGLSVRVRGVFEITRLEDIFEIRPTVEEALA